MYVLTNREYDPSEKKVVNKFGSKMAEPIDALRLAEVTGEPGSYSMAVFEEDNESGERPSEDVVKRYYDEMRDPDGRGTVFFIHGYNNDFEDALDTAHAIESIYDVNVILFTWPSNGKVLTYRGDKDDAENSKGALGRALEMLTSFADKYGAEDRVHGLTFMAHSMGNYLTKHLLLSKEYEFQSLIFDNVVLCSADTNVENHEEWVDKIRSRRKIYVCINEDDGALAASRAQPGEKQQKRLGHSLENLNATYATYLNFTDANEVGKSHSYFIDEDVIENPHVRGTFNSILKGNEPRDDDYELFSDSHILHVK